MDRERLLRYIDREYLPKRDVLSHIPLGASLDEVWEEAQRERRKKATLLSPMRGSGAAPWFVLTDSMIAASEKIVEEAMLPYQGGDVAALEEAFYTSYVEGSPMTAEEAMAFVKSGEAPRDIHEQMLQNNRQAIAFAMENAFHPITEEMIRTLAGILTKEMDGGGENYRDSDTHVIPSMGHEPYTVPTAAAIPGLMRDLCQYLASGKNHPLLKAAVAHACFLVYRPFNEGNERLARLVAFMILMKAKYTFFNEVSISAIIAQDGYGYFEAVANTLGEVDGGDMTYLVKFYIETLGKAVDEIHVRRQQREEELARQALKAAPDPPARQTTQTEVSPAPEEGQIDEPGEAGEEHPFPDAGTVEDALRMAGFVPMEISDEMTAETQSPISEGNGEAARVTDGQLSKEELRAKLEKLMRGRSSLYAAVAARLMELIEQGKTTFTRLELTQGIAELESQTYGAVQKLKEVKILLTGEPIRDELNHPIMTYILNLREGYSKPVLSMIQALLDSKRSQKDRRIGTVLSANLEKGCVEYSDYEETGDEARWQSDMKFACQLGLLTQVTETRYTINRELGPGLAQMDRGQKKLASRLFDAFGQESFTTEMILATLDYPETHTHATLHAFTLMGILDCTEGEIFSYQFRFTPEEHPECFEQAA